MSKKILSILFVGIIIFGLTGCGEKNSQSNSKSNKSSGINASVVSEKAEDFFGKKVNYSGSEAINSVDWNIYDADDNNIYLISSDYVLLSYANVPKEVNTSNYAFNVHGTDREGFLSWLKESKNWNNFVNSDYADKAQGASTIEQYVSSYNKVHNKDIYISGDYSNGYNIGNNENPTTTNIKIEKDMDIYYNKSREKALGYFLIAPSTQDSSLAKRVYFIDETGFISSTIYSSSNGGIRPIITLSSDVKLIKQDDGSFNISK